MSLISVHHCHMIKIKCIILLIYMVFVYTIRKKHAKKEGWCIGSSTIGVRMSILYKLK